MLEVSQAIKKAHVWKLTVLPFLKEWHMADEKECDKASLWYQKGENVEEKNFLPILEILFIGILTLDKSSRAILISLPT